MEYLVLPKLLNGAKSLRNANLDIFQWDIFAHKYELYPEIELLKWIIISILWDSCAYPKIQ